MLEIKDFDIIVGQLVTDVIFGSQSDLKFVPLVDDINETVMPDQTKARFYNFTNYTISFSLIGPTVLTSRVLDSGSGTEYTLINSGSYSLELIFSNQNSKTITISFNLGRIYTVYFIDNVSPDNPNYYQLNIPQVILVVDGNTMFTKCIFI